MTFKFHFPAKSKSLAPTSREGNPEGPKRGNLGKKTKKNRRSKNKRLRGSEGTSWQNNSEGSRQRKSEGPEGSPSEGYARFTRKKSALNKKTASKIVRTREIRTRVSSGVPEDFGPFSLIAKFGRLSVGIEDIREAKKVLSFHNRIPVSIRFYVNIDQIKNFGITSALVTLENDKVDLEVPPPVFARHVEIARIRQEYAAAYRRYRRSIIDSDVVDFASLYENDDDVRYDFTLSNLNFSNLVSKFTPEGLTATHAKIRRDNVISTDSHVKPYSSQVSSWTKGVGVDPGDSINKSPAYYNSEGKPIVPVANRNINLYKTRDADRAGTGSSVYAGRMGSAAASLSRGFSNFDKRKRITCVSKFVPIVVKMYIKRPNINDQLRVRVQLKAKTIFANQVIASGSKKHKLKRQNIACKTVTEAPIIRARYSRSAEGGDWYNISVKQRDHAATHISVYGKAFDKSGNSMKKGWTLLRTVSCTTRRGFITTQINTNIDKLGSYAKIALRAVSTNRNGIGSKYASTGVVNPHPVTVKSHFHTETTMPCVFAVNSANGIDVTVRNLSTVSSINIIREELGTGETKIMHARIIKRTVDKVAFRDFRVKEGTWYRYYVNYIDKSTGETSQASHKDAVIKKVSIDRDIKGINLIIDSHSTSMGSNPSLDDDSVGIVAQLSYSDDGLSTISRMLNDFGIQNTKSREISKISENFNKIFGIRVSRIHVQSGERVSYGYYRIGKNVKSILVSDNKETRKGLIDNNFGNLIPGDTYVYNLRLHKTTIPELLGGDDTAESTPQNPKLSLSILKGTQRRFIKNNSTARGILPSESFVQNNNNYGSLKMAFERGFTGIELNYEVKIPESNNTFTSIRTMRLCRQVLRLSWKFSGDYNALDHFVVFEVAGDRKVPIGARVSATRGKSMFRYHVVENLDQYDRTYLIEAYDDNGEIIDTIETEEVTPVPPIDKDVVLSIA